MIRLNHLKSFSLIATASVALATTLAPAEAEACGGTFCDSGPTAMPVDQTGENIIFVMNQGMVEAHIQIQYDPSTTAESFAWVVPVPLIPEFEVGSEFLFDNVLNGTVPTYGFNQQFDSCGLGSSSGAFGSSSGTSGDDGAESGTDGGGEGGGPSIVHEETVGAFDITVLSGGTADEVMTWLADNGYQQDPAAEPILAEYLNENFMFAAMKLNHRAGIDQVHPIVIRTQHEVPCVPLRLTRIAAADDMNVRVFFLGEERVVPTNYRHVEVNPLKIDWVNFASNYPDVVSLAVDAEGADGNAFVTEYAGTPNIPTSNLHRPTWNDAAIASITDPTTTVDVLSSQGLMWCDEWYYGCQFNHPLLEGLLSQYLPVPAGVEAGEFYANLANYAAEIDPVAWDATAFAGAVRERIIDPGLNAQTIVEQNPYVTRMYTTISDHEMNDDPMFEANGDLEDVVQVRMATQQIHCDSSAHMILPDGREVYMPNSGAWPEAIGGEEMPWEEHVQVGTRSGPLMTTVDQTELIDDLLAEWNDRSPQTAPTGCACAVGESGPIGSLAGLGLIGLIAWRRRR
jgi:MYXO-CTERM domain-containing protein